MKIKYDDICNIFRMMPGICSVKASYLKYLLPPVMEMIMARNLGNDVFRGWRSQRRR